MHEPQARYECFALDIGATPNSSVSGMGIGQSEGTRFVRELSQWRRVCAAATWSLGPAERQEAPVETATQTVKLGDIEVFVVRVGAGRPLVVCGGPRWVIATCGARTVRRSLEDDRSDHGCRADGREQSRRFMVRQPRLARPTTSRRLPTPASGLAGSRSAVGRHLRTVPW